MLKVGENNVTNREYHADKTYFSSSSLKLLITDLEKFYQEKILGIKPEEEEKSVFSEGSYVHSLILEPEKIAQEYALFDGWRKQGKEFEAFKEANAGKIILSKPQQHRCEGWANAIKRRREAMELLKGGAAEYTLCSTLMDIPVKIRCDYINVDKGYIADIKTTGQAADVDVFKQTVRDFYYHLSAALYCEVAEQVHQKPFDFYFIVVSKPENVCDVYKLSKASRSTGHSFLIHAIKKYKQCMETGIWSNLELQKVIDTSDYEIAEV